MQERGVCNLRGPVKPSIKFASMGLGWQGTPVSLLPGLDEAAMTHSMNNIEVNYEAAQQAYGPMPRQFVPLPSGY